MTYTPVSSSNVAGVDYDPATRELRVTFHSGRTYTYEGVSEDEYLSLLGASSVGRYFNDVIKSSKRVKA